MMSPGTPTEAPSQPRPGSLAIRSPGHQFDGWLLAEILVAPSVNRWLRFGASLNRGQTSPRRTAPIRGSMARRGATETAPRPISSAPALGLKSTYRRELHLAFCLSRQVIEGANIFSALRAHQRHKPLMRKSFRDISTPTLLLTANVSTLFGANLPCLTSLLLHLGSRQAPFTIVSTGTWVILMAPGFRRGSIRLTTRWPMSMLRDVRSPPRVSWAGANMPRSPGRQATRTRLRWRV